MKFHEWFDREMKSRNWWHIDNFVEAARAKGYKVNLDYARYWLNGKRKPRPEKIKMIKAVFAAFPPIE